MKITAAAMIVVAAGFSGQAITAGEFQRTVIVYMVDEHIASAGAAAFAKDQASKMFGQIGIRIEWRDAGRSLPPDALVVEMLEQASPKRCVGALACAKPFEGVHIYVFYDRLRATVPNGMLSPLLAHVLVHEITHILQGVDRHSASGIMKAQWDGTDYARMSREPLPFIPVDVTLIERGLETRESRQVIAKASQSAAGSL